MACQRLEHCREHVHYSLAGRNRGSQRRISLWLESLHLPFGPVVSTHKSSVSPYAHALFGGPMAASGGISDSGVAMLFVAVWTSKTQAGFPRGPVRLDGAPFFGITDKNNMRVNTGNSGTGLVPAKGQKGRWAAFSFGCGTETRTRMPRGGKMTIGCICYSAAAGRILSDKGVSARFRRLGIWLPLMAKFHSETRSAAGKSWRQRYFGQKSTTFRDATECSFYSCFTTERSNPISRPRSLRRESFSLVASCKP